MTYKLVYSAEFNEWWIKRSDGLLLIWTPDKARAETWLAKFNERLSVSRFYH